MRRIDRFAKRRKVETTTIAPLRSGRSRAKAYARKFRKGYNRTSGFYGRFQSTRGDSELKFFDTALSFNVDLTGEVPATGQLCLIPQGVTESQRVGRKCVVKSVLIRLVMTMVPAAAASSVLGSVKIYLVQDKQTNGAAAGATDVFTGTSFPTAVRNLSNSTRFKILKSWQFDYNVMAGVSTAFNGIVKHIDWFKRCNVPLEFSSTTGAITEIRSNNLFLMAGTDNAALDDLVTCGGVCRIRFSD